VDSEENLNTPNPAFWIAPHQPTSHYFSCWRRPKLGKSTRLTFFPSTLTHPEPRLLIGSHLEAIHDAGRS